MSHLEIHKPFVLFANCVVVESYQRSLIMDLQLNKHIFIPNDLQKILTNFKGKTISDIQEFYKNKYDNFINEYFELLKNNELIYFTNDVEQFPSIDLIYKSPSHITNVFIDFSKKLKIKKIIDILNNISCKAVSLSFTEKISLCEIKKVLSYFKETGFIHIEMYINWQFALEEVKPLFHNETRLQQVIMFMCDENMHYLLPNGMNRIIVYSKNKMNISTKSSRSLSVSFPLYIESQKHHTYFNRKLYIGKNGEIKNALECKDNFGFIQSIKDVEGLKSIISKSEFQKYWFVHKEICNICKDCEFRHMCVDNRLPYKNTNGTWYFKPNCPYNPYICKWEGEEGYVLVEECGNYTRETGFVPDKKKIRKLNKQIWGE